MARYIAIDNGSGFIFGDSADLNGKVWEGENPTDFVRALDESIGEYGRLYEEVSRLASNETGYRVYCADTDYVPVVQNGHYWKAVITVGADCQHIATIRCMAANECG